MAVSSVGITGPGPLSITDKNGRQRFVPLSAFELSGSKVALAADWSTALATTVDTAQLEALATARLGAGDLTAPPAARPAPALLLTAAAKGTEGNGITVHLTADGLDDVNLEASQSLSYPGLASAADAVAAIGDTTGTGPVQVTATGPGTKAPKAVAATAVKKGKTLDVKDADDALLFTLTNTAADDATMTVAADADPSRFTVTIARGPLTSNKVKLGGSGGAAAALVTVAAPATGAGVPATADVRLSGGTKDLAASGVAYTS